MLVSEYKKNADMDTPEEFLELLPEECIEPNCGSPMEISVALTDLHCSNPRCPIKVKMRMVSMFRSIGVKGVGKEVANGILERFRGLDNPLIIMGYDSAVDGPLTNSMSLDASKKIEVQIAEKKDYTLWEYVRLANLPYVQTSALKIFGKYDDLTEAYNDIESGGVDFIAKKLDIKSDGEDVSVRALNIYETLLTFKKDLFDGLGGVNIIKQNDGSIVNLSAVCSDEVGEPFKTKNDFYTTVNNRFADVVHVDFLSSVTKSIDYLIWAGADGSPARLTNKVKKVRDWNEKYKINKANGKLKEGDHIIPIVTANQFIMMLQEMSGEEE